MRHYLLLALLCCFCGCIVDKQGTSPTTDESAAPPAFRASKEIVSYELLQRRADNNHWDEGRPLDAPVGEEIFKIAARGTEFDIKKLGPVSIGVMGPHYKPPPYVISVSRTDADGAMDYITFCHGLRLFAVTGDYRTFAAADADAQRLAELIRSIRDPAMAPVE